MSKLTDPPKCKNNCGRGAHWGPCFVRDEKPPAPSIIDVTPNKSTAARMDVPSGVASPKKDAAAGTQAPPVDKLETARKVLADVTTRGTPRKRAPKGTFDRKAHQAKKARERRAAKKAEAKPK